MAEDRAAPPVDPAIARRRLAGRFVVFLRAHPELSWVSYSAADGSFTGAVHAASGEYRTNLSQIVDGKTVLDEYTVDASGAWTPFRHEDDTGYDPRTRPFYELARDRGRRIFTEPYIFYEQGLPGITCAVPDLDADQVVRGVVTVDFDLNRLSAFVAGVRPSRRGEVFVLTPGDTPERQIVLAHPTTRLVETRGQGAGGELVSVADVDDLAVRGVAAAAARGRRGFFSFDVGSEAWYGNVAEIEIDEGLTWLVGAAAPQADFTGDLRRDLRTMLLVNLAVLAAAVLAAFALASGVSRPLVGLAAEMAEIGEFRLDERRDRHSVFREIELMHEALERTKGGLRSFAAYVPRDLVRSVLASGHEAVLEGEVKELTVFFSDIAGFTTLAESRTPEALVELLGAYLDDVTREISTHQGTVDKFLGDGVMAFWGAPADNARHAALACEAALRIQRRLAATAAAGGPRLSTRIGLATGPVLVGNIGSHERMNYTVMGDVANLAARLEGLNKQYGTSIMIAEATALAAGDRIVARPVDVVAVKGKVQAVRVFEILALGSDPDAAAARELAAHCTTGLDRYLARDFAGGAAAFEAALGLRPDDEVAARLRERCRGYAAEPPSADWTGVFHATEK
jgi:adenylate cyclase